MSPLGAVLLAVGVGRPEILAVTSLPVEGRAAVQLLASAPLSGVVIERRGDEVTVSFEATAPRDLALPAASAMVESITLAPEADRLVLSLRTAAGVPHEVRSEGPLLTVLFGAVAPAASQTPGEDVEALYASLFAAKVVEEKAPEPGPPAAAPGASEGLRLGPVSLQPGLALRYVDSDSTFLDTPEPTRARYWELSPRIAAVSTQLVEDGRLSLAYEPRLRRTPDAIPALDETSHFLDVELHLPVSWLWLSGAYHFSKGVIETREVDPGGEYFFDLGRFHRNLLSVSLRTERSGRLELVAGAGLDRHRVDQESGWFDYDRRGGYLGLRYELNPGLNATLQYAHDRTPASPERALVESKAHTGWLRLEGEITPFLTGDVAVGYRTQSYPLAARGGDRFEGWTLDASLRRQIGRAGRLALNGFRSTYPSAFEANAFYVASGIQAIVTAPLPLGLTATGGAGYQWNRYRLDAAAIGAPREDRISGWNVGLGRSITRSAYARVDYRRDLRSSNLPGFSTRTWALLAQVGMAFHSAARP